MKKYQFEALYSLIIGLGFTFSAQNSPFDTWIWLLNVIGAGAFLFISILYYIKQKGEQK